MIYIFGDTHREHDIHKLNHINFPEQRSLSKKDYVIICGDWGVIWNNDDVKSIKDMELLQYYNEKNFTTLIVDGNHDNIPLLNSYPEVEFCGGIANQLADTVYHLKRGEIYNIDGHSFFAFGGATSTDQQHRLPNISWWHEELPTPAEMDRALANLAAAGNKVDYILTHCCSSYLQYRIKPTYAMDVLTDFFTYIEKNIDFKHWYFGHYHIDQNFGKHTCLYSEKVLIK